jgi:hypothetical protein
MAAVKGALRATFRLNQLITRKTESSDGQAGFSSRIGRLGRDELRSR